MPQIAFTTPNGSLDLVDGAVGSSAMEAAVRNGVPGIVAECGGAAACSTCHVYVAEEFLTRLPDPSSLEDDMLEGVASERLSNSRLSCQLSLTEELDGLALTIAPEQQ